MPVRQTPSGPLTVFGDPYQVSGSAVDSEVLGQVYRTRLRRGGLEGNVRQAMERILAALDRRGVAPVDMLYLTVVPGGHVLVLVDRGCDEVIGVLPAGGAGRADQPSVFFAPDLPPESVRAAGFVAYIDGRAMPGPGHTFHEFGKALRFPSYFGNNWDALIDCLGDVGGWIRESPVLVVVEYADALITAEHLPLLVDALCLGSDRAAAQFDADGVPIDRAVARLQFGFRTSAEHLEEAMVRVRRRGRPMQLTPTGLKIW